MEARKLSTQIMQEVFATSLFYKCYFGRCSSELAELVPLPYSYGKSLIDCIIFLSSFLDVIRMSMSTFFFVA